MIKLSSNFVYVSTLSLLCTYALIRFWQQYTDSPSLFLKVVSIFPIVVGYFFSSEEIGFAAVGIAAFFQFFVLFSVIRLIIHECLQFARKIKSRGFNNEGDS